MVDYVLGLAFSPDRKNLLLIRKNRPEWQAGCLNGIGGKVEPKEFSLDAMCREFWEETGIKTEHDDWKYIITMQGPHFYLEIYKAFISIEEFKTMTDEEVFTVSIEALRLGQCGQMVSNLRWLVEVALDENLGNPFHIVASYQ